MNNSSTSKITVGIAIDIDKKEVFSKGLAGAGYTFTVNDIGIQGVILLRVELPTSDTVRLRELVAHLQCKINLSKEQGYANKLH